MLDKQTLPTELFAPQPHSAFFVNKVPQIQIDREVGVARACGTGVLSQDGTGVLSQDGASSC